MLDAPRSHAYWFLAGDAFHTVTEQYDLGETVDPVNDFIDVFDNLVGEAVASGTPMSEIKAGGRVSKQWPNREDYAYWSEVGPMLVADYVKWIDGLLTNGWSFLTIDDRPAIELPFEVELGGVNIKGFIDRVLVNPAGEVIINDLKTGSRTPESVQLGVYRVGLLKQHGVDAALGSYYMARNGNMTQPVSLLHYTPELLGEWFSAAKRGIEAEVFIPHVSPLCNTCGVRQYCRAVAGDPTPLSNHT